MQESGDVPVRLCLLRIAAVDEWQHEATGHEVRGQHTLLKLGHCLAFLVQTCDTYSHHLQKADSAACCTVTGCPRREGLAL